MRAEMTELVMPGDANPMGTAFGGRIMQWIDIAAGIAAQRAVGAAVTASVDGIEFNKPIRVGDIVTLKAGVNKVWNTSMEVGVQVTFQSPLLTGMHGKDPSNWNPFAIPDYYYYGLSEPVQACRAYLTFVAVTDQGKRRSIEGQLPDPEGAEWIRRSEEAEHRRAVRLANRKAK